MRLHDRIIAGVVWLSKFTIFSPFNLREDTSLSNDIIQWGNYAIGYNIYPNLFNIFVQYSPTANNLINKAVRLTYGNIPKEIKGRRTTNEKTFTNTILSLVKNAGRDAILFQGSFAIWVGYDENGRVDEFKQIPLDLIRYVKRDEDLYPHTESKYMIGIMGTNPDAIDGLYYPYEPAMSIIQGGVEPENKLLKSGQILFYNTANDQTYPDCVFNAMLPVLLADAGIDTMIMSFMGNSDILKTYKKKNGSTGADSANGLGGMLNGNTLRSIWGADQIQDLTDTAQFASDYYDIGVKSSGSTEYIAISDDKPISDYVKDATFPKFMDEIEKIDERCARKLCVALELPYEYVYKMGSGVVNQDNRESFIKELNILLEDQRETLEGVINDVIDHSIYKGQWLLNIRAIGEGKENVADANENITE